MSFALFSSKKDKTGGALISKLTQDNSLLLTLFKQIDFDENNKKNNFDWQTPINVKLSDDEIGDFLRAVRTNGESKFYHTFDNNTTTGSFKFYSIEPVGEKPGRKGYGLSVTKGEVTIKVGFSLGAAERFGEFLSFCLNKVFEAGYIEDLAKEVEFKAKAKEKKAAKEKTVETPKSAEPVVAASSDDADF